MRYVGFLLFAMVLAALAVVMNMAVRQDAFVACKDDVSKQMPNLADVIGLMTGDMSAAVGRMQVCMSGRGFSPVTEGCDAKKFMEKQNCYSAVMDEPYLDSVKTYIGLGK